MVLEDKLHWTNLKGAEDNIVLSSSIQLFRNVEKEYFLEKASLSDINLVESILKTAISKTGMSNYKYTQLSQAKSIEINLLKEEDIIPSEASTIRGNIYHNDSKNNSILTNIEEHCIIQSIATGLSLPNCLESVMEIEEELDKNVDFAFNTELGYLTSSPNKIGCAMKIYSALSLPVLLHWNKDSINNFADKAKSMGYAIFYRDLDKGRTIYFTNKSMIGMTEKYIVDNGMKLINSIIDLEKKARDRIFKIERYEIEDKIYRSRAILSEARSLKYSEFINHLMWLKVGAYYGLFNLSMSKASKATILAKPHHLRLKTIKKKLKTGNTKHTRAKLIRDLNL